MKKYQKGCPQLKSQICRQQLCVRVRMRVCIVCVCVCVFRQFVWVGSLFWFLLFFSPFQCFPPLLCSKDKFGRFAKFITFHWWIPSLFTLPQLLLLLLHLLPSPRPPPAPGYLYWSVGPLLCASLLFMSRSVALRLLGSIRRHFDQPAKQIHRVFILFLYIYYHSLNKILAECRHLFIFTGLEILICASVESVIVCIWVDLKIERRSRFSVISVMIPKKTWQIFIFW